MHLFVFGSWFQAFCQEHIEWQKHRVFAHDDSVDWQPPAPPTTQGTLLTPLDTTHPMLTWLVELRAEAGTEADEEKEEGGEIPTTAAPVHTPTITLLNWSTLTLTPKWLGSALLVSLLGLVLLCESMTIYLLFF